MRYIAFFAAIVLIVVFVGCATEMPQADHGDSGEKYPPAYEEDIIDTTLYETSSVNPYSRYMLNMPGSF